MCLMVLLLGRQVCKNPQQETSLLQKIIPASHAGKIVLLAKTFNFSLCNSSADENLTVGSQL